MRVLRDVALRLLVRLAHARRIEGVEVRVTKDYADAEILFTRLAEGLRLLRDFDPRRYRRAARSFRCILVTGMGGARYVARLGLCVMGAGLVRNRGPVGVAMAIVHEATHARLWKAGIRYDERLRSRIERICVGEEIAFARLVPGSEDDIAKAEADLESEWWTPEATLEAGVGELRRLGAPRWFIRLSSRRLARRHGPPS